MNGCVCACCSRGGASDSYMKGWTVHDIALGPAAYWTGHPDTLARMGAQFFDLMLGKGPADRAVPPVTSMVTSVLDGIDAIPSAMEATTSTGKVVVRIG
jgi:hypothetical protein